MPKYIPYTPVENDQQPITKSKYAPYTPVLNQAQDPSFYSSYVEPVESFVSHIPTGMAQGTYEGMQSLLNPALHASADIVNKIKNLMGDKPTEQALQLPSINISKEIGLPQDRSGQYGELAGQWGPLALGIGDAAFGALARKSPKILEASQQNLPYLKDILTNLPKKATSSDISNAAVQGGFKSIMDKIGQQADAAYSPSTPYIYGDKNIVNIDDFIKNNGKEPSNEELFQYLAPQFRNPNILESPATKDILRAKWLQDNPQKINIVDGNVLQDLSTPMKKSIDTFMKSRTAEDLKNVRDLAGQELANADFGDAGKVNYRDAIKQVRNISDQIMENHLVNDPKALQGWRMGNAIKTAMYHPVMNNSSLEQMSRFNPLSKNAANPEGQPYYFTGATPKEVNTAVTKAQRSPYGLVPDHPVTELNDIIQRQLSKENKKPGYISKGVASVLKHTGLPNILQQLLK